MRQNLTVPEKHQLNIARKTLRMSDIGAKAMGGMTKEEARLVIKRLIGKTPQIFKEDANNGHEL